MDNNIFPNQSIKPIDTKINQKGNIVKTEYFDLVVDKICHKLNNKISITEKDIDPTFKENPHCLRQWGFLLFF